MQPWQASESAELLAEVQLGAGAASTVAWCPVNGLLAVGARLQASMACVYLMSPHCFEHRVTLAVPLEGLEDDLVCVAWSPAGCRRVLLVATRSGTVSAWSQHAPARSGQQADMQSSSVITLGDWWCHSIGQLIPSAAAPAAGGGQHMQEEHLLSMQWLQPPSRWPYSNRVLQEHDFQAGSVPNMFAPAASHRRAARSAQLEQAGTNFGAADLEQDPFHWVQPGTLAFAAVLSSGKAVVGWATWSVQGQLKWQLTPGLPLTSAAAPAAAAAAPPPPVPLLAGAAAWSVDGIVVAWVTQQAPDQVQVVELRGNPLHHQCLSATLRSQTAALQVVPLTSCTLPAAGGSASIRVLAWDPHSNGQRLLAATGSCSANGATVSSSNDQHSSPGHVHLLTLTQQQQQQPAAEPYVLAPVGVAQVASVPTQQQCVWLLEGLLVGRQLHDAQTLAQLPLSFPQPAATQIFPQQQGSACGRPPASAGMVLQALAASPHKVVVAAVVWDSSSSGVDVTVSKAGSRHSRRLVVYSIPPVSKAAAGGAVAPTLAGRLVWSLLLQLHSWDVVQHVLHAAKPTRQAARPVGAPPSSSGTSSDAPQPTAVGRAALQAERVAQVLSLVDRKLAVQPDELYANYALRWDGLKCAVVSRTPGGEARALSIDIRIRQLMPVMEIHLAAAAREDDQRQAASTSSQQSTQQSTQQARAQQGGNTNVTALAEYMGAVLDFEIACINTWLHRRIAAAAAAAAAGGGGSSVRAAEDPKAVPCLRIMLDPRTSTKLAALFQKAVELGKPVRLSRCWNLYKQLNKAMDGTTEPPANWEDMLLDVVPGPFELHPQNPARTFPVPLLNLRLPPEQLLRHVQALPDWQAVPVLTDADITAKATRLGLLPAKPAPAKEVFNNQVRLHAQFRGQLPDKAGQQELSPAGAAGPVPARSDAAAAAGSGGGAGSKRGPAAAVSAAKRRRWQQQVLDLMGCTDSAVGVGAQEVMDFLSASWSAPAALALQSVDGAVLAREVCVEAPQPAADSRGSRKPSVNVINSWVYACPLTGEMWMRNPSAAGV